MKTVVLVTRTADDYCTPRVEAALAERGARAVRLETDRFPGALEIEATGGDDVGRLHGPDGPVDLAAIDAVWFRRFDPPALPADLEADYAQVCIHESVHVLEGLIDSLPGFHLDPQHVQRRAEHKQRQLGLAARAGLRVPRTLVTNAPAAVRDFARACPGGIVTKMMRSFKLWRDGRETVMFTSPVPPEALDDLDGLSLCPMTFQERVEKRLELRVVAVGRALFAAAVDSQADAATAEDWRRDGVGLIDAWRPFELPAAVAGALHRLLDDLGLNYASMDLILTPEGELVFLEANPVGEYFWLEDHPGLPISAAIADVLLERAPRR